MKGESIDFAHAIADYRKSFGERKYVQGLTTTSDQNSVQFTYAFSRSPSSISYQGQSLMALTSGANK